MKDKERKLLATWLYTGATAIIIQIILGGITRLTGSGLSITEWKPLLGMFPPMNAAAWEVSFNQYKEIAQFKLVNANFSIEDYKSIYFWEWLHRNWARFIGYIFLIPFVYFLFKRMISRKMFFRLIILFALGILQALIGWIMVKSGLNNTAVAVSEIRLAIHFITALVLLCYTLWLAFDFSLPKLTPGYAAKVSSISGIILALLLLQLFYGALMAGSKAALAAPTWPDMNGSFIPEELYQIIHGQQTAYLLSIQFIHRTLAYLIAGLIFILYKKTCCWKSHPLLAKVRIFPIFLVTVQIILGIITLIDSYNPSYKIWAILHQANGLLLLSSILLIFYLTIRKNSRNYSFPMSTTRLHS